MTPSGRKVCFYVMTVDTGFAPNPFHGVCTLAACTPNHAWPPLKLGKGDLIAGCFRSGQPVEVVYVMEVAEVLDLDHYRHDPRFDGKKPAQGEAWKNVVGDNIYIKSRSGQWRRDANARPGVHTEESDDWKKDLRGNRVFVGQKFVYFGAKAEGLSAVIAPWLPYGQGTKYLREDGEPELFARFHDWVFNRPRLGRLGMPRDMKPHATSAEHRSCR